MVIAADLTAAGRSVGDVAKTLNTSPKSVQGYLTEWRKLLGAEGKWADFTAAWAEYRKGVDEHGQPLQPGQEVRESPPDTRDPSSATFDILKADTDLSLNDDLTWSSRVTRTIRINSGYSLGHLRHWNSEPKNSESSFKDYHCDAMVDSIAGIVTRSEFRLVLRPADRPTEANHIFQFRPPLTEGCVATYTVQQRYGGTPTLASEAAKAALQRVDYAGWAGVSKGWLVDHNTHLLRRVVSLPSWYQIEGVEMLVSEKGNPDPTETTRAEANFVVVRSDDGVKMTLEIERPMLNFRYAIRWLPLASSRPPASTQE